MKKQETQYGVKISICKKCPYWDEPGCWMPPKDENGDNNICPHAKEAKKD